MARVRNARVHSLQAFRPSSFQAFKLAGLAGRRARRLAFAANVKSKPIRVLLSLFSRSPLVLLPFCFRSASVLVLSVNFSMAANDVRSRRKRNCICSGSLEIANMHDTRAGQTDRHSPDYVDTLERTWWDTMFKQWRVEMAKVPRAAAM